ncbi:GNAT family N-acetyltransferase [Halobellus sp. GM3]|uniref:GNAT family N-acetyltransferase n=1 Tax=Halobellus sp. GM3 TaxID=3458410 RepID=UPI00403DD909
MAKVQPAPSDGDYEIRRYRPRDRSGFLALYEDVWGRSKGQAWFDWRFADNPYADGVQMVVAEDRGTIVGAEPLLPLRLATDRGRIDSFQPVDWIVHPDHRRRGLFTRMTEELLAAAGERAELLFNFPNDPLRPGLQKFDWAELQRLATRYRVQDPARIVPDDRAEHSPALSAIARVGSPVLGAWLGALDATASPPEAITVDRVDGVAVRDVRTVYEATRPASIHVPREEAFLEWRFANPRWETKTYVARLGARPLATCIVATERVGDSRLARVLDVQPMTTSDRRARAFSAALATLLRDHADTDLIEAPASPFPGVFRRHGFLSDAAFPFDRVATATTHAVRPLSDAVDDALGCDVRDPENWLLALGDRDVE